MSPDSPPLRRLLADVALMGGGALLITASVIQLLLWSDSYREVSPTGQILVLLGVLGILMAVAVVRYGTLGLVLAGAIYLFLTTALLLLVNSFELLGFQEGLPAPYTPRSIIVPIVGLALLGGVAWLISPPDRKPIPAAPQVSDVVADVHPTGGGDEQAPEPSTLVPGTIPASGERIRWPAVRPPMQVAAAPVPEPPAATPLEEPALEQAAPPPARVDEIAPEPEVAEPPLVSELAPEPQVVEPALADEIAPEPQVAEPALADEMVPQPVLAEPALVAEIAPERVAVEPAEEAVPEPATAGVEPGAEPAAEPVEEVQPAPEPTVELAAEQQTVPEWIREPLRSTLIREQENLERLNRALGPDDPGTLMVRANIADHYLAAGDVPRAALLQEGIAADSIRILGATHPHTVTARRKAAEWRKLAKKRRNRPKVPASR